MELWIRTQNREVLVKTNIIKWEYGCLRGATDDDGWYRDLGKYKKKRALEVLDEIQKILKPQLIIKDNGKIIGSFEDTIIREGATYELKELSTYVYEMPEE